MAELKRRVSLRGKVEIDDMPGELEGEPEDLIGARVHFKGEGIVVGRTTAQEGPETRRGIGELTPLVLDKLHITRTDPPPEPDPELPGISGSDERERADLR